MMLLASSPAMRLGNATSVADGASGVHHVWQGGLYRQHTGHHRRHDPPFLDGLPLDPGMALLDLGCGDGELTASLAAAHPGVSVVGIDAAPGMITAAGRHAAPNLSFELRRMQDIEFVESFDVAISIAALHWVPAPDHRGLLSGLYRALKGGGRFLAEFGGAGNVDATVAGLMSLARSGDYGPVLAATGEPWYFPTPEKYAGLLGDAGFRGVEAELVPQQREFTKDEFEGWLVSQTMLPWTARLDPEGAERFSRDAVAGALERARDGDIYRETFKRVRVTAEKA